MKVEDRACFNCEASEVIRIPSVGATTKADYMGLCYCRQRLSDHFKHILCLTHTCAWHSDFVSQDKRYPHWREAITDE